MRATKLGVEVILLLKSRPGKWLSTTEIIAAIPGARPRTIRAALATLTSVHLIESIHVAAGRLYRDVSLPECSHAIQQIRAVAQLYGLVYPSAEPVVPLSPSI